MQRLTKDMINVIGWWTIRLILVGGVVYGGLTGNSDAAVTLSVLAILSFLA